MKTKKKQTVKIKYKEIPARIPEPEKAELMAAGRAAVYAMREYGNGSKSHTKASEEVDGLLVLIKQKYGVTRTREFKA